MAVATTGTNRLGATPDVVWAALHDVSCLRRCIPRCRTLARVSATRFDLTVHAGVGPVSVPVGGTVDILDSVPGRRLRLGGAGVSLFGDAAGQLSIDLGPTSRGCTISHRASVDVGGVLAALGPFVLVGLAETWIDQFIRSLAMWLAQAPSHQTGAPEPRPADWISSTMSSAV